MWACLEDPQHKFRRSLVATEDVSRGTTLIEETPLFLTVDDANKGRVCSVCLKILDGCDLISCSSCNEAVHCSTECQKDHPPIFCHLLLQLNNIRNEELDEADGQDLTEIRLMLDVLTKIQGNEKMYNKFVNLVSNWDLFPPESKWKFGNQANIIETILMKNPTSNMSHDEIAESLARIQCNALGLQDIEGRKYAVGIFENISMMNHSCQPNVTTSFHGTTARIRSIQDIPSGSELNHIYCDIYQHRDARRRCLNETYRFVCQCPLCLQHEILDLNLKGFRCNTPQCQGLVMPQDDEKDSNECDANFFSKCNLCHVDRNTRQLRREELQMTSTLHSAMSLLHFGGSLSMMESMLTAQFEKISPHHTFVKNSHVLLLDAAISMQEIPSAIHHCEKVIECIEQVYPKHHRHVAMYWYLLSKLHAQNGDPQDDIEQRMQEIIAISCGSWK
eukprot:TRINITY_DN7958_c0_g1_i2.p1 TRINITY_DN7958_c0_g1~~TRINITY_DN7958_c0_g1_i2.p1  ORF type:complete len:447 (+),score=97.08 TRINITY_DN7958_c0_g1_i2:38-1378(+)